jgi:flagellar biosynthesis/type III secretory pathway protein FliH
MKSGQTLFLLLNPTANLEAWNALDPSERERLSDIESEIEEAAYQSGFEDGREEGEAEGYERGRSDFEG